MHVYYAAGAADFKIYMTAAHMVHDGDASQLYDLGAQSHTQQLIYPLFPVGNDPLPYNHPAAEALVFLPLALVATTPAYYIFFVINVLMLFTALFLCRRAMPAWDTQVRLPLMLLAAAFYPVVMCLFLGQDSILLLLLYALSFHAIRRGHLFFGGLLLGCGCFKPHLVLPFAVLFFVVRRRWKAAQGFAVGAALVLGSSLWLSGMDGLRGFLRLNAETQQYRTWLFNPHLMADLRGLIQSVLASQFSFFPLLLIIIIISLIFFTWCVLQLLKIHPPADGRNSDGGLNIEFSFCVISTVLVAYHVYPYDLTILIIPFLFLLEYAIVIAKKGRVWVLTGIGFFLLLPLQTIANASQLYFLFALDLLLLAFVSAKWMYDKNDELSQTTFSTSTRQA